MSTTMPATDTTTFDWDGTQSATKEFERMLATFYGVALSITVICIFGHHKLALAPTKAILTEVVIEKLPGSGLRQMRIWVEGPGSSMWLRLPPNFTAIFGEHGFTIKDLQGKERLEVKRPEANRADKAA